MTLTAIFSILNNVSIRRNICLNFLMFTRENKSLFWQKWTPVAFSYFRTPCWCPCTWAPTWRLHTNLYKFVWNIMSNNSSMEYRTDLRLGQSTYLYIVYSVWISWLHSLNGFRFLFWWRDSEPQQQPHSQGFFLKNVQGREKPWERSWQTRASLLVTSFLVNAY